MSKRKDLSLKEKIEIFAKYDNLPKCSQREAALKLGISQPALCKLLKNRDNVCAQFVANGNLSRKRKRLGKAEDVEGALLDWFKNARLKKIPISRGILSEKAEHFAQMMGVENFTPSNGWLTRWKQRNNIVFRKLHGEKQNADFDAANYWKTNILPDLLKDYDPHQIFNTDETGLFYRALPQHTHMFKTESNAGFKKIKQRVTVLLTCNMTGTVKKTPLVIGGSKKPRCFKGVKSFPVVYRNNKNSWMTSSIFTDFLVEWDRKLKQNIALVLDNCKAHPTDLNLQRIKLVFLPPNTTSVIQPLDQGIIKAFKCHYRKELARKAVEEIDDSSATTQSVSLLDGIHYIKMSWDTVSVNTIKNCFLACGFKSEESQIEVTSDDEEEFDEDFLKYVEIDEDLQTSAELTDAEIVEQHSSSSQVLSESENRDEESDSDEEPDPPPTATDARKALHTLRRILENRGGELEMYEQYYSFARNIERIIAPSKQTTIDQFFHKA